MPVSSLRSPLLVVAVAVSVGACAPDPPPASLRVGHVQLKKGAGGEPSGGDGAIAATVVVDGEGSGWAKEGGVEAVVQTSVDGVVWADAKSVVLERDSSHRLDVVLVADNSGSQSEDLGATQAAVKKFGRALLGSARHRAGVVRVSTEPKVLSDVTGDASQIERAADGMFVSDGWTALWDAVRVATEVLEASAATEPGDGSVCHRASYPAVVLFTNGEDNNSSDEKGKGDGVPTTRDDVSRRVVGGIRPVLHTVGVGNRVDEAALREIAAGSGGQYRSIGQAQGLVGALEGAAATLEALAPLCFVPADCAHARARITVKRPGKSEVTQEIAIPVSCSP